MAFILTSVNMPAHAQMPTLLWLPKPGTMVNLSPDFAPAELKGIVIHPENALKFDFIIDKGNSNLSAQEKRIEYKKLIKYFLASLAVPDKDQWVNLSPYEKNHIIEKDFGQTLMGRDLLAQDYLLKQITSSLIYPEKDLGKKFWDKVYAQAQAKYGNTNIPFNTFNKVWIVPDKAVIYEKGNIAYVVENHLKVMLEEDYLSLSKHDIPDSHTVIPASAGGGSAFGRKAGIQDNTHAIGSQIIREIILPALEKEVNEGQNFALLRQIYSGMLLAAWYKRALKESLLGKIYADKNKISGVDYVSLPGRSPKQSLSIESIYQQYLQAFKKGVFNYIKEDIDTYTRQPIPRKYFSGGTMGYRDFTQIAIIVYGARPSLLSGISRDDAAAVDLKLSGVMIPGDAAMRTVLGGYKEKLREVLKDHPDLLKRLNAINDPVELQNFVYFEGYRDPQAMAPIFRSLAEYLERLHIGAQEIRPLEPEEFWNLVSRRNPDEIGNAAMAATGIRAGKADSAMRVFQLFANEDRMKLRIILQKQNLWNIPASELVTMTEAELKPKLDFTIYGNFRRRASLTKELQGVLAKHGLRLGMTPIEASWMLGNGDFRSDPIKKPMNKEEAERKTQILDSIIAKMNDEYKISEAEDLLIRSFLSGRASFRYTLRKFFDTPIPIEEAAIALIAAWVAAKHGLVGQGYDGIEHYLRDLSKKSEARFDILTENKELDAELILNDADSHWNLVVDKAMKDKPQRPLMSATAAALMLTASATSALDNGNQSIKLTGLEREQTARERPVVKPSDKILKRFVAFATVDSIQQTIKILKNDPKTYAGELMNSNDQDPYVHFLSAMVEYDLDAAYEALLNLAPMDPEIQNIPNDQKRRKLATAYAVRFLHSYFHRLPIELKELNAFENMLVVAGLEGMDLDYLNRLKAYLLDVSLYTGYLLSDIPIEPQNAKDFIDQIVQKKIVAGEFGRQIWMTYESNRVEESIQVLKLKIIKHFIDSPENAPLWPMVEDVLGSRDRDNKAMLVLDRRRLLMGAAATGAAAALAHRGAFAAFQEVPEQFSEYQGIDTLRDYPPNS
jgi:hypothetical protein